MQKLLIILACALVTGCSDHSATSAATVTHQQSKPSGPYQQGALQHADSRELPPHFWKTLRTEFRLPIPNHPRIQQQQLRYLQDKYHFQQVADRAQPYLELIVTQIRQHQLPMELLLLPMVESAFDPHAHSNKQAVGLWQITPQTGRHYALVCNPWYDGRLDIMHATAAALTLLKDLNRRFNGDWLLTLAAYNSGAFRVAQAVKEQQKRGGDLNFWSLELPRETVAHVVKLLAISAIFQQEQQQALNLPELDSQQSLSYIDVGQPFSLSQAATLADLPLDRLKAFNPGYRRASTGPTGPYHLLLPRDRMVRFKRALVAATSQQQPLTAMTGTAPPSGKKSAVLVDKL